MHYKRKLQKWPKKFSIPNIFYQVIQLQIFQTWHLLGTPPADSFPPAMSKNGPQPMEVESQEKLMKNEDFSPEWHGKS